LTSNGSVRTPAPAWLGELLGVPLPAEGEAVEVAGRRLVMRRGMLRADEPAASEDAARAAANRQTATVFGFKWARRDSFDSRASLRQTREWLVERYGDVENASWWDDYADPLLLDAGCGASMSALELFGPLIPRIRYLGIDVSDAVDVAVERFRERGLDAAFVQADLTCLPLRDDSVDVIFCEGVLHHTASTRDGLLALARLLKPGGRLMFYVYRRKGPIREFTDDYVRAEIHALKPDEAWRALEPLTRLGITLGELHAEIEIPEEIALLGIPAGRTTVQRLFYWHVAKAYYHPDLTFDELNHINFDWYAPVNAHRHSPEEVRSWCADANLEIDHENIQPSGITIVARRRGRR
jgi:ubiquinone/menaquinone biosynthesis C-methylase UbiE